MAPTRMKLRVRRRGGAAAGDAGGGERLEEEEEEEESRRPAATRSSRRKNNNASSAAAAAATISPAPTSSSSSTATASARAVIAAEEASPDSKCPICLDRFNNLAYLDRCLHRFCFPCIQEWSHNKAECPLCKQPFASILHSVRAEDDFKEYTLRQPPASGSVAATVALVAAMASAARNNHQMRLMLRRHRGAESGEATARRRRRERGGRGRAVGAGEALWAWYLDSPPVALPRTFVHHTDPLPGAPESGEDGREPGERPAAEDSEPPERGVIFEGLTGLGGAVTAPAVNDRESRRLLSRLAARRRLQREGGPLRRARERETVAFRRGLYRCGIRVSGVAGVVAQERGPQQQRDVTAEGFRQQPTLLGRLRPWLRRELTVLYGAHVSLVDIVQRIIMARLSRHGLEDMPTIEEELRPFLLARTDHFLHELVSFARSPLCLESYDMQAVYEPPAAALEQLDADGSSSESSSVIAISEGEEEGEGTGEGGRPAGNGAESPLQRATEAGSSLSMAAWDDETPGPSYSTAEPSAPLSFSPGAPEAARQDGMEREEEEECLIVGYKKPIAERTPELVQLSSDSEEEEEPKQEPSATEQLLPSLNSQLSYLPAVPPSTSGSSRHEQEEKPKENEAAVAAVEGRLPRQRSWSSSSEGSRKSVSTPSPAVAVGRSQRLRDRDKSLPGDGESEKKRRKRSRRELERSRNGALLKPRRHSPSPLHSSLSSSSPPADFSWDYNSSQVSPLTSPSPSSSYSPSPSSSSLSSVPPHSPPPLPPSVLTRDSPPGTHEKPSGKRKYKSRHLDNNSQDPTWRPAGGIQTRERRRERKEKERRRRKRREKRRRSRKSSGGDRRRSRLDRSPSVEIIYEGTTTAAQPPTHKRRRKRQRGMQISPPVVITLDSDSSHGDVINVNSNINDSSSPLSSQHTVDFSHLLPLPLLPSTDVGAALQPDVGELPADILDRGSDSWEAEPRTAATGAAASPITVDNSDVDVETIEQRRSSLPPGLLDHHGPPKVGEEEEGGGSRQAERHQMATLLDSLQGSCSTPNGPSSNNIGSQLELKGRHMWVDGEHKYPPIPPPPLLERLGEGKDLPSLLNPTGMHSRNTPPPLKHKDATSSLPPSVSSGWGGETLANCSPAPSCHHLSAPLQRNPDSSFSWTTRLPPCSLPELTSCRPPMFDGPDAGGGTPASIGNKPLPPLPPDNSLLEEPAAGIGQPSTARDSRRPHASAADGTPHELIPDLQDAAPSSGHTQNDSLVAIRPKETDAQPGSSVLSRTEGPSAHADFHTLPEEFPQPAEFSPETPKCLFSGYKADSPTDSFLPTATQMSSSTTPAVEGWSSEQPGSVNSSSC